MSKNIYIVSLGCSKNFVDTEVMAASLMLEKLYITPSLDDADLFLINTCAFIQSARDETQEVIEEAIDWKLNNKNKKIIVSGCVVQWDKNGEFRKNYTDVDLWIGIDDEKDLGFYVKRLFNDTKIIYSPKENSKFLYDDTTPRLQLTLPHYAYIKISDGCNNNCSYCSIPNIRGNLRSRSIKSIVQEANNLLNNGVKELILIGQDLTAFGNDNNELPENIINLLKELDNIKGNFWVRLLYAHPASFSKELINIFETATHLLPYLDIPLQHISNPILKSMNRKINKQDITSLLKELKKRIPNIAIRTTFLVGYPNETEDDFQELYDFIKTMEFDRLGVFSYSQEPNTNAVNMKNQISADIAKKRCDKIMKLQSEISFQNNNNLRGKTFDVIIDSLSTDQGVGRTYKDAPEIDNTVIFNFKPKDKINIGDIIKIKITDSSEYDLEGETIT